jgi:hypothetical protein
MDESYLSRSSTGAAIVQLRQLREDSLSWKSNCEEITHREIENERRDEKKRREERREERDPLLCSYKRRKDCYERCAVY